MKIMKRKMRKMKWTMEMRKKKMRKRTMTMKMRKRKRKKRKTLNVRLWHSALPAPPSAARYHPDTTKIPS